MTISASTIDRALKADRQKLSLKGQSGAKPGSLLKSQIPVSNPKSEIMPF